MAAGLGVVLVVVAIALAGLPGPGPLRRASARDLSSLADRINETCSSQFGLATVSWVDGRVNYPSGSPTDLSHEQRAMLGSGAKVGCIHGSIS